jgi:hypothetical protein
LVGLDDPSLQALSDGLWAALQNSIACTAAKDAAAGAAAGVTLEQLTIAKVCPQSA